MVLVDTSAWIEWLMDTPTAERIAPLLPDQDAWVVPTMVQLELCKWLTREVGEDKADQVIAFTQLCRIVDLDTATALAAAELSRVHGLAMADAIIYATATAERALLITCDRHFEGLPGVSFVAKVGA
jgi:predicted nucleic acid-binding protein